MFTGIIEQLGSIKNIHRKKNLLTLEIHLGALAPKVRVGDSICVSGCCLTVSSKQGHVAGFDLMKETLARTSLGLLKPGDQVNLEPSLKAGSRIGGHFVSGHVDEMPVIKSIAREPNWVAFRVAVSAANRKYLVPKGSVALDGISLTVGKTGPGWFEVYLIPYTLRVTTLGAKKAGDRVNIETDILAKYLFGSRKSSRRLS